MGATLYRLRTEFRQRWRALLALALLTGVAGGVVLGAVMGARRTQTAFPRFLEAANAEDVLLSVAGTGLEGYYDAIADLPEVAEVAAVAGVGVQVSGVRVPEEVMCCLALVPTDASFGSSIAQPNVVRGRLADPEVATEITVNRFLAEQLGVQLGDRLTIQQTDGASLVGPPLRVHVVGITVSTWEVIPLASLDAIPALTLTPAWFRRYVDRDALGFDGAAVVLAAGGGSAQLRRDADRIIRDHPEAGGVFFADNRSRPAVVQRAIQPQVGALVLFAGLAGLAMLFVLSQALNRRLWLEAGDAPALAALGMSRTQLFLMGMVRTAMVASVGALIAVMIAVAGSRWTPIGPARLAEPSPGLEWNVAILAAGAAAILVLLLVSAASAAWRASRARSDGSRAWAPSSGRSPLAQTVAGGMRRPSAAIGVRFALEGGRGRNAVPVRSTITGMTLALAALVAAVIFGSNLDRLVTTPRLYGQDWNYMFDVGFGEVPDGLIDAARDVDGVEAASGGVYGSVLIADQVVPAVGMDLLRGRAFPTLAEGSPPGLDDEIVLGSSVLRRIGSSVGDRIEVEIDGRPRMMRVVGRSVFPKLGQGSFIPTALGEGAAVTRDALGGTDVGSDAYTFLVLRIAGELPPALLAESESLCEAINEAGDLCQLQPLLRPADIDNYARVRGTPMILLGVLAFLALATLAHLLITSIRSRRRDLAILKTIGFVGHDVASAVSWQATALTAIAVAVGIPGGLIAGTWGYRAFAEQLGILPEVAIPSVVFLVVVATWVLAQLVAAWPARAAARTRPALVLRAE